MYDFDMNGFRAIHVDMHREWLDPIFWLISGSGLGWVQGLLIISLIFIRSTRYYVLPLAVTLILSGVVVADGVKLLLPRDRPSLLAFTQAQEDVTAKSFISGHSTTSFGIAFMLLLLTWRKENAWIGQVALGWAALVGLSRIYRGVHWPTDVIGGMFGGLFSACLVYVVLGRLGHLLHLDTPVASLSGQEAEVEPE